MAQPQQQYPPASNVPDPQPQAATAARPTYAAAHGRSPMDRLAAVPPGSAFMSDSQLLQEQTHNQVGKFWTLCRFWSCVGLFFAIGAFLVFFLSKAKNRDGDTAAAVAAGTTALETYATERQSADRGAMLPRVATEPRKKGAPPVTRARHGDHPVYPTASTTTDYDSTLRSEVAAANSGDEEISETESTFEPRF
ncbi:hypothetical protein V5799_010645 [Amblyomma americanum]|uniref:Transmembrane protein n=1 Tax=Amblyomma americanum TaxID=6943 RepID=A0AAQ4EJA9_AMBAM